MPDHEALQEQISRLFSETMHAEAPAADTDLFEGGALDSLGFVDLVVRMEEQFGIRIPVAEVELDDFRTIARMAAYVAMRNGHARTG